MCLAKIIQLNSNITASMKCLAANTIYYTLLKKTECVLTLKVCAHLARACDKNHIPSDQLNDIVYRANLSQPYRSIYGGPRVNAIFT